MPIARAQPARWRDAGATAPAALDRQGTQIRA